MSEDNATDTQEAEERPLIGAGMNIQALLSIPATAAIGIGVVYALGALARSVELAHAGISVRDAFPLIPVEQHLGRGIQLLVQPVVLVVILILVVMIGLALYDRERPKRPVKPITKRRRVAVNAASAVAIRENPMWIIKRRRSVRAGRGS